MPKEYLSSPLVFETLAKGDNKDTQTLNIVGYTGVPVKRYYGTLVVDVDGVNFASDKIPILEEHELERKIGVSTQPTKDESRVYFNSVTVLDNSVAKEFLSNAKKGFPYQASIGVEPLKVEEISEGVTADVNGYTIEGPAVIFRESTIDECSICVFGADSNTEVEVFSRYYKTDLKRLDKARMPKYKGTEEIPWGEVDKSLAGFLKALGKDADTKVKDLTDSEKKWMAEKSLLGNPKADTFSDLVSYPVVNPATGKLNKNGVLAALRYASKAGDAEESIKNVCNKLLSNFKEDNTMPQENNKGVNEEVRTTLTQMQEEIAKLTKERESLQKEKEELKELFEKERQAREKEQLFAKINLNDEHKELLGKVYGKVGNAVLMELASELEKLTAAIEEVGKPKGKTGADNKKKEPTLEEAEKFAKENCITISEAYVELTKQTQEG